MPALPPAGGDPDNWITGAFQSLNAYLLAGHDSSGKHLNVYNVWEYGITGGTTDDVAINASITAAVNSGSGGIIQLEPITHQTSNAILLTGDNIILRGYGWSSVIQPGSGAQYDAIAMPIPGVVGTSGFVRNFVGVEMLAVDCSNMLGTIAGRGNGIHFYGSRYGFIDRVYVKSCKNWAILLDGDSTGPGVNFGYDNLVSRCDFDLCNANISQTNCEANDYIDNRFKWAGTACAAAQPAFGSQTTFANHLQLQSGYAYVSGNVFGKGGTYTTPAILCSNSGPCRIIGNRFDQVRNQAVTLNAGTHEFAFNALGSPGSAATGVPAIQIGNSNNRVIGNSFDTTAGGSNFTYAIAEAGGPFVGNIIAENSLLAGTSGLISLNAGSTDMVHHNYPYNPVGSVTPPAFPATTVAATNNSGVDVTAYIANGIGAITVVQIAGAAGTYVTTGYQIAASGWGSVRIPAGGSVKFTYASGAPTWTWMGD